MINFLKKINKKLLSIFNFFILKIMYNINNESLICIFNSTIYIINNTICYENLILFHSYNELIILFSILIFIIIFFIIYFLYYIIDNYIKSFIKDDYYKQLYNKKSKFQKKSNDFNEELDKKFNIIIIDNNSDNDNDIDDNNNFYDFDNDVDNIFDDNDLKSMLIKFSFESFNSKEYIKMNKKSIKL